MARNGFRLKAELIARPAEPPTGAASLAKVWVDTGVFHLDGEYSYLIPGNLNEAIVVGSSVVVPFNGRELSALVVSRESWDGGGSLKYISAQEGSFTLITPAQIELIKILAQKYIAHPFDLLRSFAPSRVISIEKALAKSPLNSVIEKTVKVDRVRADQYLQLPPHRDRATLIAAKLQELLKKGPTLAIFPDAREVDSIAHALLSLDILFTRYDSSQGRSDHFSSYLDIVQGQTELVIGTRSAIFAPVFGLSNILIYNEGSQHYFEQRAPGWNVREVAAERSILESTEITFVGYSPSLELARLIKASAVTYRKQSHRFSVQDFSQPFGELIPSRALPLIKKSLGIGPVLCITPAKGWAHAIRCTHCKTLSKCKCGGNYEIKSSGSPITCNHCGIQNIQWICSWCKNGNFALIGRGMDRHAHEIGKLFPGSAIKSSSADLPFVDDVFEGIVISTQGLAPNAPRGYSAIIFLEGNRALNQPDMRAQERARDLFFSHGALVRDGGTVLLIQDEGSSLITALRMWNPLPIIESELNERLDLGLPPFAHTIELTLVKEEITRFKSALIKSRDEGRLPADMKILGPIIKGEKSSIVLSVELGRASEVNLLIHEFMRRRSAAKKALPTLRINPYSLSR